MKKQNRTLIVPFLATVLPMIAVVLILFSIIFNNVVRNQINSIKTEHGETITSDIEKGFETWIEDQILLSKTLAVY